MNQKRKEEIIMATLKLASEKGLAGVSMSMIAESVGIKKPSLYNHFSSKEQLIEEMYEYLRNSALNDTNTQINDYEKFVCSLNSAYDVLSTTANNYIKLTSTPAMQMFYKVVYSERAINPISAKIMAEETTKMINATKELFSILQSHEMLKFSSIDSSAVSFALTIHGLMDYYSDLHLSGTTPPTNCDLIDTHIKSFCREHIFKE